MSRTLHRWALTRRSPTFRWTFAVAATATALAARLTLDEALPQGFPYLTFFPAVILTTFFAGLVPGVATAAASGLLSWYYFIDPAGSFELTGASARALSFYLFIVATDIVLIYVMARALQRLAEERARSDRLASARDLMFRELQHRVSNNLTVVASLIKMQRRRVGDAAARQVLDTATGRLNLVARVQRELNDPATQAIDLSQFLRGMVDDIVTTAAAGPRVVTSVQAADPVIVDSERAVPVALIVAELLANAVEHAFSGGATGRIAVRLADLGTGTARLEIEDDGRGLPAGFTIEAADSLGMMIARELAAQIGGTLSVEGLARGSRAVLTFEIGAGEPDREPAAAAAVPLAPLPA